MSRPSETRIARERIEALLDRMRRCRVVVIGDTPLDVEAARLVGAESIGVATGPFSVQALRDSGASFAFADLASEGALEAMLETG